MDKINFDFKNRTALVTGGAQGFGLDIAKRFLQSGAKVIIWDIDQKMIEKAEKDLNNSNLKSKIVDVSNYKEVQSSVNEITKNSNIDILINNAGITGPTATLWEYDIEIWKKVVDINLMGTFNCCKAIVPSMIERGLGHIVNMGSTSGIKADAQRTAYAASKFAIHGFSESLRRDYAGKGIRVTEINPGIVRTDFAEVRWGDSGLAEKFYETFDDFMEPEDIAAAILYALTQPARVNVAQIVLMQSSML